MKLFLIYSCIAIPVWVAQFALYFFLRSAGRMKESLVAKCAGSFLAVGSAALAMARFPPGPRHALGVLVLCAVHHRRRLAGNQLCAGHAGVRRGPCVFDCLAVGIGHALLVEPGSVGGCVHPHRPLVPQGAAHPGQADSALPGVPGAARGQPGFGPAAGVPAGLGVVARGLGHAAVLHLRHAGGENQLAHWDDTWQKPIMALYWAALYLISMGLWVV